MKQVGNVEYFALIRTFKNKS